jgi:purine nucleoside permease
METMKRLTSHGARLGALLLAAACSWSQAAPATADNQGQGHGRPRPVKLLIISMFAPEAQPWQSGLSLTQAIPVPGLSPDGPEVHCNADDVCQVTTGMGYANVASSISALVFSRQFNLKNTYFLVAGIAGIDPAQGTLGSAAWARYVVDFSLQQEIDAREKPAEWPSGYIGIMTSGPNQKPSPDYRNELFKLDEALLQKILQLTRYAPLADSPQAQQYRALYGSAPANLPPTVIQCDTASGNTWWHGHALGQRARDWTKLLTDGQGTYCTTQQEDNATLEALKRGASAGLLDFKRVAVLRTGSNFDRPHAGQTAFESLKANSGGFPIATQNLYLAGAPWVEDVVRRWPLWRKGVPQQ